LQGLILLLLAGVMICCLGIFLSLPTLTSEEPGVPSALAGANVGHVNQVANAPDPVPPGSYPLTPAVEFQDTDNGPVNAYLLTMLVLAIASSFGTSTLWLLTRNPRRRGAEEGRRWLVGTHDGPSFLGVFLL
jgi:hypothetical protein